MLDVFLLKIDSNFMFWFQEPSPSGVLKCFVFIS